MDIDLDVASAYRVGARFRSLLDWYRGNDRIGLVLVA